MGRSVCFEPSSRGADFALIRAPAGTPLSRPLSTIALFALLAVTVSQGAVAQQTITYPVPLLFHGLSEPRGDAT